MLPPPRLRFTVLDLMLLTAAAALGLGLVRLTGLEVRWPVGSLTKLELIDGSLAAVRTGWAFLAPLAPALLLRQLATPERWRKPVWQRPGIVAGAAITLTLAVQGGYHGIVALKLGRLFENRFNCVISYRGINQAIDDGFLKFPVTVVHELGARATFAILGAWLTLFLAGAWRAEPTWIDRLGRLLGLVWVLGYLISEVATVADLLR